MRRLFVAALLAFTACATSHETSDAAVTAVDPCHTHRHDGDVYRWKRFGVTCAASPPVILIEFGYPADWSNRRVRRRCNRLGGDFSPVSHHGRNCYDIDF